MYDVQLEKSVLLPKRSRIEKSFFYEDVLQLYSQMPSDNNALFKLIG